MNATQPTDLKICIAERLREELYRKVQISVTSESVSSIMDVKLNVLKYPQLGQLAELLVLPLTGLRNTAVTIPSTPAGYQDPQSVPRAVTHTMSVGEENSQTPTLGTHSYTYIYINGNTHNERLYTFPPICVGSTVSEASLLK